MRPAPCAWRVRPADPPIRFPVHPGMVAALQAVRDPASALGQQQADGQAEEHEQHAHRNPGSGLLSSASRRGQGWTGRLHPHSRRVTLRPMGAPAAAEETGLLEAGHRRRLLLALAAILVLAFAVRLGCAFALRTDMRATFLGHRQRDRAVLLAAAVATRAAPRRCRVEDTRRAVSRRCGAARSGPSSSGGIECGTPPRTASTRAQAQRWPAIHAMVARSRGEFSMPLQ